MKITGENQIAATPQQVWEALNDPEVLRQSIPGCESLEKISDNEFKAKVVTKIGPVKTTFNGEVTLSDLDPPTAIRFRARVRAGAPATPKAAPRFR